MEVQGGSVSECFTVFRAGLPKVIRAKSANCAGIKKMLRCAQMYSDLLRCGQRKASGWQAAPGFTGWRSWALLAGVWRG
jgi:hypothetical protein